MQTVSPGISMATHPFSPLLQPETKSSGWKTFILKARLANMPLDCGVVQKFIEESFLVSLAAISCSSINWEKKHLLCSRIKQLRKSKLRLRGVGWSLQAVLSHEAYVLAYLSLGSAFPQ